MAEPSANAAPAKGQPGAHEAPLEYDPDEEVHVPDAPEFASLFPVPERRQPRGGGKRGWSGSGDEDESMDDDDLYGENDYDDSEDDEGYWLTPRMAYKLFQASRDLVTMLSTTDPKRLPRGDLPPAARQFFCTDERWRKGYINCFRRLAARLAKGWEPSPNCTGEEMALHTIMKYAEIMYDCEDEGDLEPAFRALPRTRGDSNWELMRDVAFEDEDVLMLYDVMVAPAAMDSGSALSGMMDFAHLHPKEWFMAFRARCAENHRPDPPKGSRPSP